MQLPKVVVTGMGAITPLGLTVEKYWKGLNYTVNDPRFKKWRKAWNRLLPKTSKDWYWRYYPKMGQWRLMPVKGATLRRSKFIWDDSKRGQPMADMPF